MPVGEAGIAAAFHTFPRKSCGFLPVGDYISQVPERLLLKTSRNQDISWMIELKILVPGSVVI